MRCRVIEAASANEVVPWKVLRSGPEMGQLCELWQEGSAVKSEMIC